MIDYLLIVFNYFLKSLTTAGTFPFMDVILLKYEIACN